MAVEVIRHHRLLELYLAETLGLDVADVHEEADRLEHAMSEELEARIDKVLGYPDARSARRSDSERGPEVAERETALGISRRSGHIACCERSPRRCRGPRSLPAVSSQRLSPLREPIKLSRTFLGIVLRPAQVGPGYRLQVRPDSYGARGFVTLDLCGFDFPSQSLWTNRIQVD